MTNAFRHIARCTISAIVLMAITACGGASSPPPRFGGTVSGGTDHTVGGTVSGLVGQGLTIELLNLITLAHHTTVLEQIDIVADGPFVFRIPPSQSYGVAIVHQPHSPAQRCVVRNGQGVIGTTNVSDVGVVCGEFEYVTRPPVDTISTSGTDATAGTMAAARTDVTAGLSPKAITSTPDKGHLRRQ